MDPIYEDKHVIFTILMDTPLDETFRTYLKGYYQSLYEVTLYCVPKVIFEDIKIELKDYRDPEWLFMLYKL